MKTESLTLRLKHPSPLVCPGVYDALTAAVAVESGFEALYLSGASIACTRLGRPDIGLVSMGEVADVLSCIRERVEAPVIVDADTGFGNALNVHRTVRVLERAGASAVQLEDQTFPKRCGHLQGKSLITPGEMVGKIRAALDARDRALIVARTDAIAVEGPQQALERAELYLEAGADILFIEAPETREQMAAMCVRFAHRVPMLANMVEGGRTPMYPVTELAQLGYRLVIFPGGTLRAVLPVLREYYGSLCRTGSTEPFRDRMLNFGQLQTALGTAAILEQALSYDRG